MSQRDGEEGDEDKAAAEGASPNPAANPDFGGT